ncbi:hypothetical protein [Jiangella mangrovi]|uniref:Uncharacterized protein n=1 Tax=Jiangella mangrovi TaxID=1524084 RepID=A0A7W9GUM1_9ACTN|nr:hypothetical protein [Jiangella mangrovi]MBB5790339.1 hypothetical protein [Jiangella mangrovi]
MTVSGSICRGSLTDEPQWPASAVRALALILDCLTMAMDSIGSIVRDDPLGDFIMTVNVRKLVAFESLSIERPSRPLLELMGEAGGFVPICTWWEGARLVRPYE